MKPSTILVISAIMLIIGVAMLSSTAFQGIEEYEVEVLPEGQNETVTELRERMVWKSRNLMLSLIGGLLTAVGVLIFVLVLILVYLEDLI